MKRRGFFEAVAATVGAVVLPDPICIPTVPGEPVSILADWARRTWNGVELPQREASIGDMLEESDASLILRARANIEGEIVDISATWGSFEVES